MRGVGEDMDEGDEMMNEGDKSSTTHVTRTVLMDNGVVCEGVWWKNFD